ncbi:MAG: bifunctional adenosylcobinamide kinase/adenosylcobinamide-phosphate guanylyltransferase [Gammaproteobacteria bacterium]|nr:MAG: bifunctional adenosylcobinamide kinase/adenosylcobinamide-phosphate guanylyltransferase [Gammaproteobacteria bacterium]
MSTSLILGGVKSGKSHFAEQLAIRTDLNVVYIATASADDDEMLERINKHQQQRPAQWLTVESPINLASTIQHYDQADNCILVDCLTLWLTNLLMADNESALRQEIDALLDYIKTMQATLIMVSNETNMGITPLGELTRRYCDEVGVLHQRIAQQCEHVVLTVAGLPHYLKGQIND